MTGYTLDAILKDTKALYQNKVWVKLTVTDPGIMRHATTHSELFARMAGDLAKYVAEKLKIETFAWGSRLEREYVGSTWVFSEDELEGLIKHAYEAGQRSHAVQHFDSAIQTTGASA